MMKRFAIIALILTAFPFQSIAQEGGITYRAVRGLKGLINCPASVPPYSLSQKLESVGTSLRQCRYKFDSVSVIVATYRKQNQASAMENFLRFYRDTGYATVNGHASAVLGITFETRTADKAIYYETLWSLTGTHHDYIVWASYRLPTHKHFVDDIYRKFLAMISSQQ